MPSAVRRRSAATSATGRPSTSAGPGRRRQRGRGRGQRWRRTTSGRWACAARPASPAGEQEVDRPVGVAQPQEHPQALGHRARALGIVLREVPGAAERLDRTLDVTEAEAQAGGVPEAGPRFVVARELSSTTGSSSSRARRGSSAATMRDWSRCSHAGQSLRPSRGSARQAASSRAAPWGSPVCCASRARAACTGRRW